MTQALKQDRASCRALQIQLWKTTSWWWIFKKIIFNDRHFVLPTLSINKLVEFREQKFKGVWQILNSLRFGTDFGLRDKLDLTSSKMKMNMSLQSMKFDVMIEDIHNSWWKKIDIMRWCQTFNGMKLMIYMWRSDFNNTTHHYTINEIIQLLQVKFNNCVTSWQGYVNWSSRACDLTPLEFFI